MLDDKELLPQLFTSQTRWLCHIQFPDKLLPINVNSGPQMLRSHLAALTLQDFSTERG